jgi:hypothetical protein
MKLTADGEVMDAIEISEDTYLKQIKEINAKKKQGSKDLMTEDINDQTKVHFMESLMEREVKEEEERKRIEKEREDKDMGGLLSKSKKGKVKKSHKSGAGVLKLPKGGKKSAITKDGKRSNSTVLGPGDVKHL